MRIALTGSIAYDYIMRFPGEFREMLLAERLDRISVSFLVDDLTRQRGGIAANIAYTLALLGERPVLVGTAGQDFGDYRQALEGVGVDTSGVAIHDDLFTASFFVSTDLKNNQIASFYTGAMQRSRDLPILQAVAGRPDLVVISPNDPVAMMNYVRECKREAIPYLYDPSQQIARASGDELREGVEGAEILVTNDYEHGVLCQKTGLSAEQLRDLVHVVIITKGIHGADIFLGSEFIHIPVFPTERIIDPTGVGDGFRAGLLKGLAAGWGWELSSQVGSLAAAYVLEQVGPQSHFFTPREFINRFREFYDDHGVLDGWLQSLPA